MCNIGALLPPSQLELKLIRRINCSKHGSNPSWAEGGGQGDKSGRHFCTWLARRNCNRAAVPVRSRAVCPEKKTQTSRDKGDPPEDGEEDVEDGEEDAATLMHKLLAALKKARNSSNGKHL